MERKGKKEKENSKLPTNLMMIDYIKN